MKPASDPSTPLAPPLPGLTVPPAQAMGHAQPRPAGVTVVAVFQIIGASLILLAGTFALLAGGFLSQAFDGYMGPIARLAGAAVILVALVILLLGGLVLAVGIGNLGARSWAWALTIALSILGIGIELLSLIETGLNPPMGTLVMLAIHGTVLWYFFTARVRAYFGKARAA